MNRRGRPLVVPLLFIAFFPACVAIPAFREVGLERTVFPGLETLGEGGIAEAFHTRVELATPVSAGLVWVTEDAESETRDGSTRLNGYDRTGVLLATLAALRNAPIGACSALPTVPISTVRERDRENRLHEPLAPVRRACARFQYDVALVMQTSIAEDAGFNVLALGYVPLVTAPFLPGTDRAAAASAEILAVDVRTGVPLGCGRGRFAEKDRFLFFWQSSERAHSLAETALAAAAADAVRDRMGQLEGRIRVARGPSVPEGTPTAPTH